MVNNGTIPGESALNALRHGWRRREEGDLAGAEQIYLQVLQDDPTNAHALDLLGQLAFQRGRVEMAVLVMRRAVFLQPRLAAFHHNLGLVLVSLGQLDEATACFRHAVYLKPDYADAFNNLGNVLAAQGESEEAIRCYRQAIHLRPDAGAFCNNLGTTLADRGDHLEAMAYFAAAEQATQHPDPFVKD